MGEGLELAGLSRGRDCGGSGIRLHETRQEDALRPAAFGSQSSRLAGGLQGTEVDVGGEVLRARISQHVGAETMGAIGP